MVLRVFLALLAVWATKERREIKASQELRETRASRETGVYQESPYVPSHCPPLSHNVTDVTVSMSSIVS